MNLQPRSGALVAFVMGGAMLALEFFLRTRAGVIHPILILLAGAATTIGLAGIIWPEQTKLTPDNKLPPLANKAGLAGFALGGLVYFVLR